MSIKACDDLRTDPLVRTYYVPILFGVVRAYQRVCSEVITRFDGHIAQLLGDGLLVYLGYPQAHEDDAHRAVRTGLGILTAMEDLNQGLQQEKADSIGFRGKISS